MAKQSVGPLVRHIDKAVLALTGAVLLLAIAQYGVVSPNKIEADGEMLGPAEVDDATREKADALRSNLKRATIENTPYDNPMTKITGLMDPISATNADREMARAFAFPPMVPEILGSAGGRTDGHDLVKVVQLGQPKINSGRSGATMLPPNTLGEGRRTGGDKNDLRDINWVTVSASFNRLQQEALAESTGYDPKRVKTVFMGTDLERRTQSADGSYSKWTPVKTVVGQTLPALPAPEVYKVEDGEGFNVSEDDRAEIDQFEALITNQANQLVLMRPLFPATKYGEEWRYPRGFDYEVTEMDAEFLQDGAECRYPECAGKLSSDDKNLSFKELLKKAHEELGDGNFKRAKELADQAEKDTDLSKSEEKKLAKLQKSIDIAMEKAGGKSKTRLPTQVLWAHDAAIHSVESGRTYQYRIRARIYNQYCGTPTLLNDPQNAAVVELVGPWSDPSEPITIDRDTIFFVKSGRSKKQDCKVELFKWVAGEWIQRSFTLMVGSPIGEEVSRVKTHRNDRDIVDFGTGATVVDINYSKPYWAKDKRNGRSKKAKPTTALVYVDASGNLYEQLEDFDKSSALYKEYKGIAWKKRK